jgi:23S rRNA pseudouridine1911/1915/1917 synthase
MEIIYEDDAILVVRKDAGIATETAKLGQKDMVSLLKNYRVKKHEEPFIGLVHRLDQPVEGILLVAKTSNAAGIISKHLKEHDIEKRYYAIACGTLTESGEFTDYIRFDKKNNVSSVVSEKDPEGKKAELSYEVLENLKIEGEDCTLVLVTLHTGRHHQIRVQFSAHGYPLYADRKYGTKVEGVNVALCSCALSFVHPVNSRIMDFSITPIGKAFMPCEYFTKMIK